MFSDITPELRLNSQFNHLLQVQQATLDKLGDAVAVFGGDARLKLHNEAFQRLWSVTAEQVGRAGDFDAVVDLCVRRLSDLAFWRDLKGRITSPDPVARAPASGEAATTDGRRLAWQSRPLPDGATLIGFADVTDSRALEAAVRDREAALRLSERLKRDFVANVSHQLRTPLTTILGYSERLERAERSGGGSGAATAVRQASLQLARLIDKVLDIAQVDSGELTLRPTRVEIASLTAGAASRWAAAAQAAAVALKTGEVASGAVVADAARLAQVFDHLVENALRHTPAGERGGDLRHAGRKRGAASGVGHRTRHPLPRPGPHFRPLQRRGPQRTGAWPRFGQGIGGDYTAAGWPWKRARRRIDLHLSPSPRRRAQRAGIGFASLMSLSVAAISSTAASVVAQEHMKRTVPSMKR